MSIVCLGEALVDLIAERGEREGERFEMHFGGALANAAVAIARRGGDVELAGGAGDDRFGDFLRERLRAEGVGLDPYHVIPGLRTPFALVHLGGEGEPDFAIHGDSIEDGLVPLAGRQRELLEGASALLVGSNTLSVEPGLSITRDAVAAAVELDAPVLFDPNLRGHRWESLEVGLERCRPVVAASTLTKTNLAEARLLAGEDDLDAAAAADALVAIGAELAVVTDGPREAAARGLAEAAASPPTVEEPQPLGAGDAFMGTLVATLVAGRFAPAAVAEGLERAGAAAAEACRRTGAIA